MRTLRYLMAASLVLCLGIAPKLTAASCIASTPEAQLEAAEIVVQATITKVETGTDKTRVTADVDEVIKGDVGDTVTFVTGSGSSVVTSVDVYFEVGDQFELYLYHNTEGELTTNTCTGTALVGATLYGDSDLDDSNIDDTGVVTTTSEPTGTDTVSTTATTDTTTAYVTYLAAALAGLVGLGIGLAVGMRMRK